MKMCLYSFKIWKLGFDCYILKYEADTLLPLHRDPINGQHWRLNIRLWGDCRFFTQNSGSSFSRVVLFRPDLYLHSQFVYTPTVKLSFGFVKFD